MSASVSDVLQLQIDGAYVCISENIYKDFDTSFNPNQGGLLRCLF